ncbi:retrovirus-related pol polyprotein from transposon TNT 1-94 [Tanacetum coccineum]
MICFGELLRKTRLLAKGYHQEKGIDFEESFATFARIEPLESSEPIRGLCQSECTDQDQDHSNYVYRLKNDLYGLKQASLLDDIIFASTNPEFCEIFAKEIISKFKMSMMGKMSFFLELQISQNPRGIFINQSTYALEMIKKYGMKYSDPVDTPMVKRTKLDEDPQRIPVDPTRYRSKAYRKHLTTVKNSLSRIKWSIKRKSKRNQQPRSDEELVPINDRVKIGISNWTIAPETKQKEPIYQLTVDILKQCSFFNAFTKTADVPEIYMQQFWHTTCRQSNAKKKELLPYPRFTKVIINHILSKHNTLSKRPESWTHTIKDDAVSWEVEVVHKERPPKVRPCTTQVYLTRRRGVDPDHAIELAVSMSLDEAETPEEERRLHKRHASLLDDHQKKKLKGVATEPDDVAQSLLNLRKVVTSDKSNWGSDEEFFLQRLVELEKKVDAMSKVDHTDAIEKSVKAHVDAMSKKELLKVVPDFGAKKNTPSNLPKSSTTTSDSDSVKEYDMKDELFQLMTKTKSFKTHPSHQELYDALMKSLLVHEDNFDKQCDITPTQRKRRTRADHEKDKKKRRQKDTNDIACKLKRKSSSAKRVVRIDKNINSDMVDVNSDMASDIANMVKASLEKTGIPIEYVKVKIMNARLHRNKISFACGSNLAARCKSISPNHDLPILMITPANENTTTALVKDLRAVLNLIPETRTGVVRSTQITASQCHCGSSTTHA